MEKVITKKEIDTLSSTNIFSTKTCFKIKSIHSTQFCSEIVLHTHFIWVSMGIYVDNGITKCLYWPKLGLCQMFELKNMELAKEKFQTGIRTLARLEIQVTLKIGMGYSEKMK